MSLLRGGGGGAYTWDKNTSVRVCTKNAGGAYARGGGRICGTLRYMCDRCQLEGARYSVLARPL